MIFFLDFNCFNRYRSDFWTNFELCIQLVFSLMDSASFNCVEFIAVLFWKSICSSGWFSNRTRDYHKLKRLMLSSRFKHLHLVPCNIPVSGSAQSLTPVPALWCQSAAPDECPVFTDVLIALGHKRTACLSAQSSSLAFYGAVNHAGLAREQLWSPISLPQPCQSTEPRQMSSVC